MQSTAATVDAYLAELPEDRRAVLQAVREVILKNLDRDYEEGMQFGMIGYYLPHRVYPAGYHCDPKQPLPFACLASQKNYMSLYMMGVYGDDEQRQWFEKAWAKTGKRLDMGKSCIRFKKLDDLALDVIGQAIRKLPAKKYIAAYEAFAQARGKGSASKQGAASKGGTRRATKGSPQQPTRAAKTRPASAAARKPAKKATRRRT
jgi:hypothetical protein